MLNSFRNTIISAGVLAIAGTVGLQYLGYPLHKIMDTPSIEESGALIDELLVNLEKGDYDAVLQSIIRLERMRGDFPDDLVNMKVLSLLETGQPETTIKTAFDSSP